MTRNGLALMMIAALAPLLLSQPKKPASVPHESRDGRFQANFPASPRRDSKEFVQGKFIIQVTTEKCEVSRDLILSVSYSDYPPEFGPVMAAKLLDGVRDGLKSTDGKVALEKELTLGDAKIPGRDLRIEAGKNVIRAQVYLAGRRIYQVLAAGNKDTVNRPEVEELFTSFRIHD